MLCFLVQKSIEVFDRNIMKISFIFSQQQFHMILKIHIWSINWKYLSIFIYDHINTNTIFCFNFIKIFLRNSKFNAFIIKSCNYFLVRLLDSLCFFLQCIQMFLLTQSKTFNIIHILSIDQKFFRGFFSFRQFIVLKPF